MRISESLHDRVHLLTDLGGSGPIRILVEHEEQIHEITASSEMLCGNYSIYSPIRVLVVTLPLLALG